MQAELLRDLLNEVRAGTRTVESALDRLRDLPFENLGYARLDHHRALRTGFPEVVFCEGKRRLAPRATAPEERPPRQSGGNPS